MKRSLAGVGVAMLIVALTWGINPTVAQANTVCATRTGHWSIQSGASWTPKIGWIELHIQTCSDGNSITSTIASADNDETAWGLTGGFRVYNGSPTLVSSDSGGFSGGYAKYYDGASFKDCIPGGITVWCGPAYDFSVRGQVTMHSSLQWDSACAGYCSLGGNEFSLHHRIFTMTWWWECRNSICTQCGVNLNGVCKSSYV